MAHVKSVTFANADNMTRKGMVHVLNGLLHAVKHGKRAGDHVLIEFDDGTKQEYVLGAHSVHAGTDGLTVELAPGVEP